MIEYGLSSISVAHENATITIYPDHADDNQFWYLPETVRLKQDSEGKLVFTFVEYIQEAKDSVTGGGFMNFAVDLRLTEEHKSKALSAIASKFGRSGNINLTPVPYDSGEVEVVYFSRDSEKQVTGKPDKPEKEEGKVWRAKSPSLFGYNDAIFGLTLSETEAAVLKSSFEGGGRPVGVAYYLNFTAMRPALNVHIKAKFKSVQERVEEGIDIVAPIPVPDPSNYAKASLSDVVDKMEKEDLLEIKIEDMANNEETAAAKEWAKNLVIERILENFFEIEIPPEAAAKAEGGGLAELALKALYLGPAAFKAPLVHLKYSKVKKTQDKSFEFSYSESTPLKLTHNPQGFFEGKGLLAGEDKSSYFQSIDITDSFFSKLKLKVKAPVKEVFERYDLSQVQARFKYDDDQKDERFDLSEAGTEKALAWQKKGGNGVYQQQIELVYKGSPEWAEIDDWPTPNTYVTKWQDSEDWEPGLEPSQVNVNALQLEVGVDEIDWGVVNSVRVNLKHVASNTARQFYFKKEESEAQKWNLRTYDQNTAYTYDIEYTLKDNSKRTTPTSAPTTLSTLYVPMPEIDTLVRIRTDAGMMKEYNINTASVFLEYTSADDKKDTETKDFDFDTDDAPPNRWSWSPSNYDADNAQPYRWRIEFSGEDDDYYYPGSDSDRWEESSARNQSLKKALQKVMSTE